MATDMAVLCLGVSLSGLKDVLFQGHGGRVSPLLTLLTVSTKKGLCVLAPGIHLGEALRSSAETAVLAPADARDTNMLGHS